MLLTLTLTLLMLLMLVQVAPKARAAVLATDRIAAVSSERTMVLILDSMNDVCLVGIMN